MNLAIQEADAKSTVYLSGGGFKISDDTKITKQLTIIGVGHRPNNNNADGNTNVSGNFWFEGGSDHSRLMGLYLSGDVNIGTAETAVNDFLLRYCNVNSVQVKKDNCMEIQITYWFDSNSENAETVQITPAKTLALNTGIEMPADLTEGNHIFNITFGDNYAQRSDTAVKTFKNTVVSKAYSIKNSEPNINELTHTVKQLATIYRYYRIVDDSDKPIQGATIEYTVNTVNNKIFTSSASDKFGIVQIEFPVWGENVNDESDDYVREQQNAQMVFSALKMNDKRLYVKTNAFLSVPISVVDKYKADEQTFGFKVSGSADGGIKIPNLSLKGKLTAGYKFSFVNLYENGLFSGIKYEHKGNLNAKGSLTENNGDFFNWSKTLGNEIDYSYNFSETLPTSGASYLKILYDIFRSLIDGDATNESVHFMHNAIASYLGISDETSTNTERKTSSFGNLGGQVGVKLGDDNNSLFEANIKSGIKFGFGVSNGTSFDGSTSVLNKITSYEGDFDCNINAGVKMGGDYGINGTGAWSSGIKFKREKKAGLNMLEKSSISLERGLKQEVAFDWKTLGASAEISKSHTYKFSFKKPFFTLFDDYVLNQALMVNNSFWNFITDKPVTNLILGEDLLPKFDLLGATLESIDNVLTVDLNKTVGRSVEKTYSSSIDISKSFDWGVVDFGWSCNIFAEGTFPVEESTFDFETKKMLPLLKYQDIDENRYYFSPFDNFDFLMEKIQSSLHFNYPQIIEKAKNSKWYKAYVNTTEDALGNLIYKWWELTGQLRASRSYSPVLKNFKALQENPPTDISNMTIEIPCANHKVFNNATEVHFSHYYPAGEVLGATVARDTFIIVSDISFLDAYYNGDTLKTAPNGNFSVYATAGADDLAFLGINNSYPVSVYHKPVKDHLWHSIGLTNETIFTNSLGKFCLGVSVNSDKESPVINISKEENANKVEITITDNMAVYWKNVFILINGVAVEWERNGSKISVNLSEKELQEDIYVTVYATDLARNEAQSSVIISKSQTGIKTVITGNACKLYPNPATDICHLFVPNELLNEKTAYAIVNPAGKVFHRELIKGEETAINVSRLPTGVYFIVVFNNNQIVTNQKLLKK